MATDQKSGENTNTKSTLIKIGTRKSLLAKTQSWQIAELIKERTGLSYEMVYIETEGDQNTELPLWQMEGKDFFTKEIDRALLEGKIDLAVHSYKDLGSIRPSGVTLGAITQRFYSEDILLLRKDIKEELLNKKRSELLVGTSSPRRIVNLEKNLGSYLPYSPLIKCSPLRGNIHTRVKKLITGEYDAICLALAGLDRLARSIEGRTEMKDWSNSLDFMVLSPLSFPSAAAQGALGLEWAENSTKLEALKRVGEAVHCKSTASEMQIERKLFNDYGGGCHLAVGIEVRSHDEDTFLIIEKGEVDGQRIENCYLANKSDGQRRKITPSQNVFIGLPRVKAEKLLKSQAPGLLFDEVLEKVALPSCPKGNILLATSYGLTEEMIDFKEVDLIACSGDKTQRNLAKQGHFSHLCLSGLGEKLLKKYTESAFLREFSPRVKNTWSLVSHENSPSDLSQCYPSYKKNVLKIGPEFEQKLKNCDYYFWSSYTQFLTYIKLFPWLEEKKGHLSGLGKTYELLKNKGKDVIGVYPMTSLRNYIKEN